MFDTYFTDTQVNLLIISSIAFLLSLSFFINGKEKLSLGLLAITAFSTFCFAALLDPFLNMWDERFHALVAKNLIKHPFKPTLYDDPVVTMAYDYWDRYHIWLHKQPLFLWQMALSSKIFGVSEFSLRLPNIILGSTLVLVTYRSGKLLVNEKVGFTSSVLVISSIYIMELIAGRQSLDHNDFTFLAYISLSIWSLIEYYYSKNKKWIYLIGIFSGMAILCKWLVGLLVYFGWIVLRLLNKKIKISENKDVLVSLITTTLIALPWQIYTFIKYPIETKSAFKFNLLHFNTILEGHEGSFWYHLNVFNNIYGEIASFLVIPAFYALYLKIRDKKLFYSLLSMVVIVYLFFSLAKTKMPSFTIVVAMIVFIAFSSLLNYILEKFQTLKMNKLISNLIFAVSIVFILLVRFNIEFLQENHTTWKEENTYTRMMTHYKEVFTNLKLPGNSVLFNVKGHHYIEAMFYTEFPAYRFIPTLEQYEEMKVKNRTLVIFTNNSIELPDYLLNDPSVIIINEEVKGYN